MVARSKMKGVCTTFTKQSLGRVIYPRSARVQPILHMCGLVDVMGSQIEQMRTNREEVSYAKK
ncbi:hypothetical protein DNHGIG_13640 [Collibacillus ludicampi]|uniref:Uncharacterized protein n=1 Tax=Collibacillus ludicampi TaxID=2771369 RepID=A0AAV4LDB7_9BACL|nr:hypothetical protein DNHGIG_13640 [Collibacillus ludicampi]